ncbi:hypothetical protein KUTeg_022592 [Tegillarca granosa]|uniref:Uncharacterized protein n=1 Tax=Tegillarca granosa TaxID=220873 RepID=A0ABQ9E8L2_TEGGR|nr:hypothetical protein KUTeg_022592 [Tegillarca granosa]
MKGLHVIHAKQFVIRITKLLFDMTIDDVYSCMMIVEFFGFDCGVIFRANDGPPSYLLIQKLIEEHEFFKILNTETSIENAKMATTTTTTKRKKEKTDQSKVKLVCGELEIDDKIELEIDNLIILEIAYKPISLSKKYAIQIHC